MFSTFLALTKSAALFWYVNLNTRTRNEQHINQEGKFNSYTRRKAKWTKDGKGWKRIQSPIIIFLTILFARSKERGPYQIQFSQYCTTTRLLHVEAASQAPHNDVPQGSQAQKMQMFKHTLINREVEQVSTNCKIKKAEAKINCAEAGKR